MICMNAYQIKFTRDDFPTVIAQTIDVLHTDQLSALAYANRYSARFHNGKLQVASITETRA